ncbi:hypothetical protein [Pseudomonas fluorescens]|uniref:hypothetical protein n=1 Tax=Pseudomonas fluorescens TaxID=294 RepID=UPI001240EB31|nr:hypothetical protein [Pseudomonas fluorescens]VVQ35325.1 hypothetical protein PS947_04501 [Pseudomonas fluorescens]
MNNNINITYKLSRPSKSALVTYNSLNEDREERREVIEILKSVAASYGYTQTIEQWHAQVFLKPGSALEQALQPAGLILRDMIAHPAFKRLMKTLHLPEHAAFELNNSGLITARFDGRSLSFSNVAKLAPELKEEIDSLIEMAELSGGTVTLDGIVNVVQWLEFHQFTVPQTGADAQKLIEFLEYQYPPAPALGNYWEMLVAREDNSLALQPEQRSQIRLLTRQYGFGKTLLEYLVERTFGGRHVEFKRTEAHSTLLTIVSSPIAQISAKGYIRDLNWFGAGEGQSASSDYLQQMLLTAVLLDLHPLSAEQQPRNHIAGFDLYAAAHTEMSFAQVQSKFEKHLVEHCAINEKVVVLAAHLLLAESAPEFLVRDLPSTLLLGTPPWVDYCRAVAVAELNVPGSSSTLSFKQINALLKFDSVSPSQQAIHALASVDPVIDWALLNSIITTAQVAASTSNALETALAAFSRFAKKLTDTSSILARPLPTRKAVCLDMLQQVASGCTFLEDDVLYQHRNRPYQDVNAGPLAISMVDLQMSNDLVTGDWDVKSGPSIYQAFPKMLPNLIPPEREFHRQFNRDYILHTTAMATHLELAFSRLPLLDRTRLIEGDITLFTVRPSVAIIPPVDTPLIPDFTETLVTAINLLKEDPKRENQKLKDAAIGRYGVVICAVLDNQLFCYELFAQHGICRENPRLGELIKDESLMQTTSRSDFTGSLTKYVKPAKVLKLPTNIEYYTHAVVPDVDESTVGVIEKLSVLPAKTDLHITHRSYYQCFYAGEFKRLASFVLKHRPIATYDELVKECWGQSKLEKLRAKRDADLDTFLNIVVPFKACIEDIASDDSDRQLSGVKSCIIEAAMTLLLVVASVAKIVSIIAQSATLSSKSMQLAKVSVALLNSLLNPVDGVPELIKGGARLLYRGASGVGHAGKTLLNTATFQMRKLTGSAQSYDLVKAWDRADINQSIWRSAGETGESLTILVGRHDNGWYALNRRRQPWGAKLKELDFSFKLPRPHWHKILPKSYSRLLVKKGLPLAKTKVDDAIEVLNDPNLVTESNAALAMLLGNDSIEARNTYRKYLQEVRTDLSNVKPSNIIYDNAPKLTPEDFAFGDRTEHNPVAELHWGLYHDWKVGDKAQNKDNQFLRIYSEAFNDAYREDHFNRGAVADSLVHELFHGYPGTGDKAYADHSGLYERGMQQLDVSSLLNLAKGTLTANLKGFPNTMLNSKLAFKTADSFALTTSLLGQLRSNRSAYEKNIAIMKAALKKAGSKVITESTVLSLNIV